MNFHLTVRQTKKYSVLTLVIVALALLLLQTLQSQSNVQTESAALQGVVRDSQNHPVAAAMVSLQTKNETPILTTHTDAEGKYSFSAFSPGIYSLRANLSGYDEATLNSLTFSPNEIKKIDLLLVSIKDAKPTNSSAVPQFFDEPQFTVAGITESTASGGHGSNTVLRSTEALMQQTVSLGKKPSVDSQSASFLTSQETSLTEIATNRPDSFEPNYRAGKLLVDDGKFNNAIPFLDRAYHLNPDDYANAYELAFAYAGSGNYQLARTNVETILSHHDNAQLHHLLGDIQQALDDPLDAVREYQRAAELKPSEPNIFDWGTELLLHRALEPAIAVFTKGNRLFPKSVRLLAALGASLFANGAYDQSAQRLCEASDLDPNSPVPYLFLGEMQSAGVIQSNAVTERLKRFVQLHPESAQANFYYAVSLWQQPRTAERTADSAQVEALLEKAVHLDPELGPGYLQLGILYSERKDFPKAIAIYQQAISVSPQLTEAHYRLSQTYREAGDVPQAQQELAFYQKLLKDTAGKSERERRNIQQFVYTLRSPSPTPKPQ